MTGSVIPGACAALLVAALSMPTFAQSPDPTPGADPGPLRVHDARLMFTATALPDGSVLVVGGMNGEATLGSAEVFDPETRRFRAVGALQQPRSGHTATALPDGRILITGGTPDFRKGLSTVEAYDPASETFSRIGQLEESRLAHTATLLDDGRLLVTGGFTKGNVPRPKPSAELFDPVTGTSTSIDSMSKARMIHTAARLEDGRAVIIGGIGRSPGPERTMEVYDPGRQRFLRPRKLAGRPSRHEALRLADGRVFVTAASGGAILIAPDARSSELVAGRPRVRGEETATLLADGRVVVFAGNGREPARVDLFDPATDTFQPAGPMRQAREAHEAIRLPDGTVLVVGGIGCEQVLDSAEIWDPAVMASVAGGTDVDCAPFEASTPPPLPPLGATTSGGRIEMPGSAFAITVPDDWTVELADPEPDVFSAEPGSAWEALRATHPENTVACSVAIGVAEVSLLNKSGTASNGLVAPRWDPDERGILWVPTPRVDMGETESSSMAPMVRLHRDHEGLEHDVLYSLQCVNVADRRFERIMRSIEFLPRGE